MKFAQDKISDVDLYVMEHTDFGKGFIKKCKMRYVSITIMYSSLLLVVLLHLQSRCILTNGTSVGLLQGAYSVHVCVLVSGMLNIIVCPL